MKKLISMSMFLVVLCCCATAFAQQPAAKAASASSDVNQFVFSTGNSGPNPPFVDVLSTSIKPPGGKDLWITFSAQTGVFTTSVNNDIPAAPSTLTSENVAIQLQVLVDGIPVAVAPPNPLAAITFDNLIRVTTRFTPGQIDLLTLLVDEGGAHSFTWIAENVGVGVHIITVQARFLFNNVRFPLGDTFSSIAALLGPKTLTVEQVQLN